MTRAGSSILFLTVIGISLVTPPQLQAQTDSLFQVVKGSVVVVESKTGWGSGFVLYRTGLIVTAAHTIGSEKRARVVVPGYYPTNAEVLVVNQESDVAVLKVQGLADENVGLRIFDGPVAEGDDVWVFGFLRDASNYHVTMTKGIISKAFSNYYQIDASLRPGFSGGPATTRGGRVLGMASFNLRGAGNFNFLVPSEVISGIAAPLMAQSPPPITPIPQAQPSPPSAPPTQSPAPTPVPSPARPPVEDLFIVPGERISKVRLGMGIEEAIVAMRRSYDENVRSADNQAAAYRWLFDPVAYQTVSGRPRLVAFIGDGSIRIREIQVTAKQFRTAGGNGVGDSPEAFMRELGAPFSTDTSGRDTLWRFRQGVYVTFDPGTRIVNRIGVRLYSATTSSLPTSAGANWNGVWASQRVSQGGPFIASLFQSGTAITGTVVLNGSPCFGALQVNGRISGGSIVLTGSSAGADRVNLSLTISGDSLLGSYTVMRTGTVCDSDYGTLNASRR